MDKPLVEIIMGSDSDLDAMQGAAEMLEKFKIPHKMTVASAHRSPERALEMARTAKKRGVRVIIAGAGGAAHLAGVLASETILPVIGVPMDSSPLKGFDSLLATVQMPAGIPVATMAVGMGGAKNAGILAAQILALSDDSIARKLVKYKKDLIKGVEAKARRVEGLS